MLAGILLTALLLFAWLSRGPWVVAPPRVPTTAASVERLRETVSVLSIGCHPRSYRDRENLARAAAYIEGALRSAGVQPTLDEYEVREGSFRNIVARLPGTERGTIVMGAHYDGYMSTPGADDNASGVAALLELARLTAHEPHRKTWIFVAFSTEEPPFFGGDDMGSARFARDLVSRGEQVDLMVAIEMVGCFRGERGSQPYPFPGMSLVYPSRGDFVAVAGDLGASRAIALVKRGMLAADALPVVSFRAPRSFGWIDLSDHEPFRRLDLPAVMVTDTGPLRNSAYHGAGDTWETLDYERMALVVRGLQAVLALADEP